MSNAYEGKPSEFELEVHGMTCDSCETHVTHALNSVAGVLSVSVPGWAAGKATVTATEDVDVARLISAVNAAGYSAIAPAPIGRVKNIVANEHNEDYDLIVIGTGGGGMAAAIKAAELDKSVLIVEAGTIGGTCVNIGCIPSKTLIRAAEAYHKAKNHPFEGIEIQTNGVDWNKVVNQKDGLVEELRHQQYETVLAANSERITLVKGMAKIHNGGVLVNNEPYHTGNKIVIAVGARPDILSLEGIDGVNVLSSTTVMSLEKQPDSLLVIGGRAIALELGQALGRLGTNVTILQRSDRLIPDHEPEISKAIQEYLQSEGLKIYTGIIPKAIREENGKKIVTVTMNNGRPREFHTD